MPVESSREKTTAPPPGGLNKPIQAGALMEALDYALEFAALERSEQP